MRSEPNRSNVHQKDSTKYGNIKNSLLLSKSLYNCFTICSIVKKMDAYASLSRIFGGQKQRRF